MNYRPDGWKNPYIKCNESCKRIYGGEPFDAVEIRAYEAGADAILDALKKQAISDEPGFTFDYWDDNIHAEGSQRGNGYLVFIEVKE